jgi:hypothetical protein
MGAVEWNRFPHLLLDVSDLDGRIKAPFFPEESFMAARVASIGDLSASAWAGKKPKSYKGTDLDKALKAWDALAAKPVTLVKDLIPGIPDAKISAIDACITKVKAAITAIDKAKGDVDQRVAALQAVATAGGKASSELTKLSEDKKLDEDQAKEFRSAGIEAGSLGKSAAFFSERDFE